MTEPASARSRRGFLRLLAGWMAWAAGSGAAAGAAGAKSRHRQSPAPAAPEPGPAALQQALDLALGGRGWVQSDLVSLELPQLAENGAIVPITAASGLPDTRSLLIFAERNPRPLLARFDFEPGTDGWVSLRVKLNESGPVLAVAESQGQFYGTVKPVKVMVGGCG
jgi:sulfur-oxidizing protein SoxY